MRFTEHVEEVASQRGSLSGTYIVDFSGPMAVSDFRRVRRETLQRLLDYIERTKPEVAAPSEVVRYEDRRVCAIQKVNDQADMVDEAFSDAAWVDSPEVADFECQVLKFALTQKKQKLQQKSIQDPRLLSSRRMLVLLNTYVFAQQAMYVECANRVEDLDFFHSVFVVQGDGGGFLLHTSDLGLAK